MLGTKRKIVRSYVATDNQVKIRKEPFGERMPNVLFRSLPIVVKRFFTDVDGVILDKNTVPANLKTSYPVYMFGAFDIVSGFKIGNNICPPKNNIDYLASFVNGAGSTSFSFIGNSGINEIQGQLLVGDIVHIFADNIVTPNYFIWIVQTMAGSGLASVIDNIKTTQNDNRVGSLYIFEIVYINQSPEQWKQALNFTINDNLGNYSNNPVNPLMFRNPVTDARNSDDIRLDVPFLLDQYIGVNTYMTFDTDILSLDFNIKKIN